MGVLKRTGRQHSECSRQSLLWLHWISGRRWLKIKNLPGLPKKNLGFYAPGGVPASYIGEGAYCPVSGATSTPMAEKISRNEHALLVLFHNITATRSGPAGLISGRYVYSVGYPHVFAFVDNKLH